MGQFSRLFMAVILMLSAEQVFAQSANSVYIDQIGSSSLIDVTQTGANNVAGNETTAMVFRGNSQLVTISQIGSNNLSLINVQGGGAVVTNNITGSFNQTTINCGAAPTTACTDTTITANATGDTNLMSITAGAKSTATASVTGDSNTVTIDSNTSNMLGARSSVTTTGGNGNAITVTQTGPGGSAGFDAMVDVNGASNTIGVTQTGTVDSKVSIKSVGSINTITVHSGN